MQTQITIKINLPEGKYNEDIVNILTDRINNLMVYLPAGALLFTYISKVADLGDLYTELNKE